MKLSHCKTFTLFFAVITTYNFNAFAISKLPLPAKTFKVNNKEAFIIEAKGNDKEKKWLWYAPTLSHYPHHSQSFYFKKTLDMGIAIAGYNLGEVRGAPASSKKFNDFYNAMVKKGYSKKPILMGQSRGGLMMLCWAFRNPDKVKAFIGIYPVCNLKSWPMTNKNNLVKDYGMDMNKLLENIEEFNPSYHLKNLAQKKIPIFIIHGDNDKIVPYKDNSLLIQKAYQALDGPIQVKIIPGKGHQEIPEFFQNDELVNFISSLK